MVLDPIFETVITEHLYNLLLPTLKSYGYVNPFYVVTDGGKFMYVSLSFFHHHLNTRFSLRIGINWPKNYKSSLRLHYHAITLCPHR